MLIAQIVNLPHIILNCGVINVVDCPLRMSFGSIQIFFYFRPISRNKRPQEVLPHISALIDTGNYQSILDSTHIL